MNRKLIASPLILTKTRQAEWVYADRIPLRTGTILAGQGGIGKSTILADVIARATRGDLPGSFAGSGIMVGIISPEDDVESVLVPRLMAAGADLQNVVNVSAIASAEGREWTTLPNIGDDLPALGDLLAEHGIRLLVVDPLVSIMSGSSISQSDVRRNFDPLSALAKDHEFALLAVAHFGKSGERAGDRLSGSHAFRDIARVVIVAAVDEETGQRVLTVEKSNYSPTLPSDAYSIESVPVRLHDGNTPQVGKALLVGASQVTVQDILDRDRDTANLGDTMQTLLAAVEAFPEGATAAEIANKAGTTETLARKYLGRAWNRGNITKLERGRFAPLSQGDGGASVASVPSSGHIRHIGHISYRDTCPKCGEPSDEANRSFDFIHPSCSTETTDDRRTA